MLHEGTGWEVKYPRDIWRVERLPGLTINSGKACPRDRLRFDQITQPWLRELVKRWSRLRLSSGLAVGTVVSDVKALRRFSAFLAEALRRLDSIGTPSPSRPSHARRVSPAPGSTVKPTSAPKSMRSAAEPAPCPQRH